eukprot:766167-Hanusia_phi.AAC.5
MISSRIRSRRIGLGPAGRRRDSLTCRSTVRPTPVPKFPEPAACRSRVIGHGDRAYRGPGHGIIMASR